MIKFISNAPEREEQHGILNYILEYAALYSIVPQIVRFLGNLTSAAAVSVPIEHYIECFRYKYFLSSSVSEEHQPHDSNIWLLKRS